MKKILTASSFAILALTVSACSEDSTPLGPDANRDIIASEEDRALSTSDLTVAEIVVQEATEEGEFQLLLEAVLAADPAILSTLNGDGPITVFAPTNKAFRDALDGLGITLEQLASNQPLLTEILLFHVTEGSLRSFDLFEQELVRMLNGDVAPLMASSSTIQGASFVATDIDARNGIIHVIDSVLLPPDLGL